MLFQFAVSSDITMGDLTYAMVLHAIDYPNREYWIGQSGAEENMWVRIRIPDDPFEMYRLMRDAVYSRVFSQVDDLTIVTDYPSEYEDYYKSDEMANVIAMEQEDVAEFGRMVQNDCEYNKSYCISRDVNPCVVAEALYDLTQSNIPYWLDIGDSNTEMVMFVYVRDENDSMAVESAFNSHGVLIWEEGDSKSEKLEKSIRLHEDALNKLSE